MKRNLFAILIYLTVKEAQKYLARGKNYVTLISIDPKGNLKDNVTFVSKSVRGQFAAYPNEGGTYVFGFLNADHTGFSRSDIGLTCLITQT